MSSIWMAWKGTEGKQRLWWASSSDGVNFDVPKFRGDLNSSQGPALAAYKERLYMAWKGVEGDQRLFLASTSDGTGWDIGQFHEGINSDQGPVLAAFNGRLYMAWKSDTNQRLIRASTSDGVSFDVPQPDGVDFLNSSQGPALAATFKGALCMAFKRVIGNQHLSLTSSSEGVNFDQPQQEEFQSNQGPALAVFNDILFMAWKSDTNQSLIWANSNDPGFWSSQQSDPRILSTQRPAVAVF